MAYIDDITALYKQIFNRTPDAGGLSYWAGQEQSGMSLADIANTMRASSEAQAMPAASAPTAPAAPAGATTPAVVPSYYDSAVAQAKSAGTYPYLYGERGHTVNLLDPQYMANMTQAEQAPNGVLGGLSLGDLLKYSSLVAGAGMGLGALTGAGGAAAGTELAMGTPDVLGSDFLTSLGTDATTSGALGTAGLTAGEITAAASQLGVPEEVIITAAKSGIDLSALGVTGAVGATGAAASQFANATAGTDNIENVDVQAPKLPPSGPDVLPPVFPLTDPNVATADTLTPPDIGTPGGIPIVTPPSGTSDVLNTVKNVLPILSGVKALTGSGSGSGAGGSGGNTYIPKGLSAADQTFMNALANQTATQNQIRSTISPTLLNTFNQIKGIDTQPMIDAGAKAGQQYGDLATRTAGYANTLDSQGTANFARGDELFGAGRDVYNLGLDPQHALYDRTLQQVQDQSRAASSLRGIGMSGNAAGLENDATKNFNLDWQNNQLSRATQGLSAFDSSAKTAAGYGQLGAADLQAAQGYAAEVPGYTQQAASVPIQAKVDAYNLPATAANNYASSMQTGVMQGDQNLMASTIPYLQNGNGATNSAFQNNLAANNARTANTAAGTQALLSGIGGLATQATNPNSWVSQAGGWLSNLWGNSNGG